MLQKYKLLFFIFKKYLYLYLLSYLYKIYLYDMTDIFLFSKATLLFIMIKNSKFFVVNVI